MHSKLAATILSAAALAPFLPAAAAQTCSPLAEPKKAQLAAYVQKRYKVPATTTVRIAEDTALAGCYRKLRFASDSGRAAFSMVLYHVREVVARDHRRRNARLRLKPVQLA